MPHSVSSSTSLSSLDWETASASSMADEGFSQPSYAAAVTAVVAGVSGGDSTSPWSSAHQRQPQPQQQQRQQTAIPSELDQPFERAADRDGAASFDWDGEQVVSGASGRAAESESRLDSWRAAAAQKGE